MSAQQLTPLGSALSGALGAIFSNAVVYPLDTVKTRLQALPPDSTSPDSHEPSLTTEVKEVTKRDVRSLPRHLLRRLRRWEMLNMLLRIIKTEGLSGVFKGFSANMINTFSQQFAYFFFHTTLRSALLIRLALSTLTTAQELTLGALAGALAQIFTIPVSVIALRQQISSSKTPKSLLEVGKEIVAESGLTGLWTGLKPGLVLTVNPAITYGVFERVKGLVLEANGNGRLTLSQSFWIGVASKTLATVVTYPYIFAKVRLQAQPRPSSTKTIDPTDLNSSSYAEIASHPPSSNSAVPDVEKASASAPLNDVQATPQTRSSVNPKSPTRRDDGAIALLLRVYQTQGLQGWYKGLGAQIIKAVLCQGILFVCKDQFESYTIRLLALIAKLRTRINIAR